MSELMDKLNEEEKRIFSDCIVFLKRIERSKSHDIKHCLTVLEYALKLAEKYNADKKAIIVSSLLHDASRHKGKHGEQQGRDSIKIIRKFLNKLGESTRRKIITAIISHSIKSKINNLPIDAQILCDADKLSGFGLLGFIRICMYAGERDKGIDYIKKKLTQDMITRMNNLYLEESIKIAKEMDKELKNIRVWFSAEKFKYRVV